MDSTIILRDKIEKWSKDRDPEFTLAYVLLCPSYEEELSALRRATEIVIKHSDRLYDNITGDLEKLELLKKRNIELLVKIRNILDFAIEFIPEKTVIETIDEFESLKSQCDEIINNSSILIEPNVKEVTNILLSEGNLENDEIKNFMENSAMELSSESRKLELLEEHFRKSEDGESLEDLKNLTLEKKLPVVSNESLDIYKHVRDLLPRHDLITKNDISQSYYLGGYNEILIVSEDFSKNYYELFDELEIINNSRIIIHTALILISAIEDDPENLENSMKEWIPNIRFKVVLYNGVQINY